jgi:predicted phosphodiesterase
MELLDAIGKLPDAGHSDELARQLADAKRTIEMQSQLIDDMRTSRARPLPLVDRTVQGGSFLRGVISDTHGSAVDDAAFAAAMSDFAALGIEQIVHIGDAIDCGGFLAERHVWGYVAESSYTFADDVAQANAQFDAMCGVTKEIHFLEGNHDRRLETWCLTEALRSTRGKDAKYHVDALLKAYAVENILSLEKRGIKHYKQGKRYDFDTPATIKLGSAVFTHGEFATKHAATKHAETYGTNVFHGHTHRAQFDFIRTGVGDVMVGGCHRCLCKLQPLWQHTRPTRWTHGYGLHLVRPNGTFLAIHIPIIDGQSFLADLADKIR